MLMSLNRQVLLALLVSPLTLACSKGPPGEGSDAAEKGGDRPAPFSVEVRKVERKTMVAPNKTYEENGLGKKPAAGKVFLCVQYTVTSIGKEPESLPSPTVTDGKGAEVTVSVAAAGNYQPEDWKAEIGGGKVEPGKALKQAQCFEVAEGATSGAKFTLADTGWGPKHKAWKLTVDLPGASADAPKAEPAPVAAPDFTSTAEAIYAEFRPQIEAGTADAVRAKYTGKTVRISGEIVKNDDMLGTWELALKADARTGKAFLHPSAANLAAFKALKAGDKATFQCVSEGWEIGPQFKDCSVVKE
ncbi:MAG: hypothetical protein H0T76_11550 [Nannocystis sp.]|nr:hypothetical protein [Nannocystis sp.]MBA3547110.1 hypothetical protein [Nannocystis sp.]